METGKKRIIITGGGTGGHIFPGIAIARELSRHPEVEVLYVGKEDGPESKWVPDSGFEFTGIKAEGFPRSLSVKLVTFWFGFLGGLTRAGSILSGFRADAVFSTGGYVSVPVSVSAALRGIPVGLLEPNVEPGLAARFLSLFSRRIFVGFQDTLKRFSKRRTQWTGIPVREEIVTAEKSKARESFGLSPDVRTLLMLGGSQGAHALNRQMADVIQFLGQGDQPVQVILMTGWNDYRKTVDQLDKCPLKVVLRPFISNIHEAYAAADLVVARAGAMTCAELLSRGLPALFIPYPHASGHQEKNARALETAGSAVVILEKELEEEKLSRTLISLLSDEARLKAMGEAAKKLSKPNAAQDIVRELLAMAASK
ncbi:MAG TPA: undecaprenyldiphospho-muramoylpentapeptide beta-N-acetylglucosaminyltransferase [bacterium]|nr:undecaprenyldiphospho-muramoylpentapeptide beta-N-acetylglucosaminyltransferase [bacterium]